jgi:hypothetical protein
VTDADWLTRARDSRCAEASKTQPPSFMSRVLMNGNEIGMTCRMHGGNGKFIHFIWKGDHLDSTTFLVKIRDLCPKVR